MSPLITAVILFAVFQSVTALNLVFTIRRERAMNGSVSSSKLMVALLPIIAIDVVFALWLLRYFNVF
jgi:hypothetical protein